MAAEAVGKSLCWLLLHAGLLGAPCQPQDRVGFGGRLKTTEERGSRSQAEGRSRELLGRGFQERPGGISERKPSRELSDWFHT